MSDDPLTPAPDDKDWTWAIDEVCPECAFDPRSVSVADVPALVDRHADELQAALRRPDTRERPAPTVWSPLEYGCHVRDVCLLFDRRLALMLDEHDPIFDNWDQDATALQQRYWLQDPEVVADELRTAAQAIAASFAAVQPAQSDRPGRRSNGSVFTVGTFARYFLHDIVHHSHDVAR